MSAKLDPWHLAEPYQGCNGNEVVGAVFDDDDGLPGCLIGEFEKRAHALLAAAAPELLAVCQETVALFDRLAGSPEQTADNHGSLLGRMRAAIAKATGEDA